MTATPFISVVVPTYNRPAKLRRCLQALVRQRYPRDHYEVAVVDDGGSAPLQELVASFQPDADVKLIRKENGGPAAARNAGAARATGTFLAFTDDDCAPASDWLSALAEGSSEQPGHLLGGRTINALPKNPYATASQQLISYFYTYYHPGSHAPFFASNNIALPAARFRELGGFSTDFPLAAGEDRAFCDAWHDRGWPMAYVPDACVHHAHALTLRSFLRQHFNYGRGAFRYHGQHSQRAAEGRLAPEPLSFYVNLLRYPLGQRPGLQGVPHAALLLLAQGANAAGYFRESLQHKQKST